MDIERDEVQYRICKQQGHVLKTILEVDQTNLKARVIRCKRCKQTLILFLTPECDVSPELTPSTVPAA